MSRRHLDVLTGELGILQHPTGASPDPAHGYRVDDVARALEVDLLHAQVLSWAAVSESAWRSLRFLEDAFDETTGRFRSLRAIDGSWLTGVASPESSGRAMLGLAHAIASAPDPEIVQRAGLLFDRALPKSVRLASPRAQASLILACAIAPDVPRTTVVRTLGTEMHARFRSFARPGWPWPEADVTYENAILPRALIVAGARLGATTMLAIGLQVLDWLIESQTSPEGHLSLIATGGWTYGGSKSAFDQQPIEATSLLLASEAAFEATGRRRYLDTMERAYAWFLGANDKNARVADPTRGAASDGITPTGVDVNEGAESTLMWLVAVEHIRAMRKSQAAARPSAGPAAAGTTARSQSSGSPKPRTHLVAAPAK